MGRVVAPDLSWSKAVPGEATEIAAFLWAAWNAADHEAPAYAALSDEWVAATASIDALQVRVEDPAKSIVVVRAGSAMVGVAALTTIPPGTAEITEILVHPMACRSGVGAEALTGCIRVARQLGAGRIRAHARDERGRTFFLHHRFQPVEGPYLERAI